MHWHISIHTDPVIQNRSSPATARRPSASSASAVRRPCWSMRPPASPTAASSASAPRSACRPPDCMPTARWGPRDSPRRSSSSEEMDKCGPSARSKRRPVRNTQPQNSMTYIEQANARPRLGALEAAHLALGAALDTKALEPVLLDVRALCSYTEYILLVSGRSDRQVDAIADSVSLALKAHGRRPLGVEGVSSGKW